MMQRANVLNPYFRLIEAIETHCKTWKKKQAYFPYKEESQEIQVNCFPAKKKKLPEIILNSGETWEKFP